MKVHVNSVFSFFLIYLTLLFESVDRANILHT